MRITMRHVATGELSQPHRLGTAEDGRRIYQHVEGWELYELIDAATPVIGSPVMCDRDADGNYLSILEES